MAVPEQAEVGTALIPDPYWRASASVRLVELVAAGDRERSARLATEVETLAAQITDRDDRAGVLASLAMTLLKTVPLDNDDHSEAPVLARARRLLAEAIISDSWTTVVSALARVDPAAPSALTDEREGRWGLRQASLRNDDERSRYAKPE